MKLCTFQAQSAAPVIGLVVDEHIIPIADHFSAAPSSMIDLITDWANWQAPLQQLAASGAAGIPVDQVTLLAPVPRPGKILAIGLNYADHVAESGMDTPADQLWFAKMTTAVTGPFSDIELPKVSHRLDYEGEMVFIVGQRCRHLTAETAKQAIFGYCIGNDVSVRDWQLRTSQFILGKSFDTHSPFGPWIVTADEIDDPHQLAIKCLVNDEVRQNSNTNQLIFDCFQQIEHLSKAMTLEPGDVIFTGTPGGVGGASKPARWLREGDRVRVEVDKLGAIENRVRPEA